MTRRNGVLAVLVVVIGVGLGCTPHGGAHPPSSASDQAAIEEAKRLNTLEKKLYGEGKFQEAFPLMERILALREKALGPHHPDVAESLNSLALLYQAQGAYAKAQPLLLRALDIREKALEAMHPDVAQSDESGHHD